MDFPILSVLILLPAAAAVVVALIPERRREVILPVGVALSILPVGLAGYLFFAFEKGVAVFQFVEKAPWYEPWGISWHLGVDGISLLLVVLTTILVPISLAASTAITDRLKLFVAMVLVLEAGLIGVFLSVDLFLFFVFFEVILIPMYFIIGIWGGERRIYAAIKFFIFTAFGSALMLAGIIAMALMYGNQTGQMSFDYTDLLQLTMSSNTEMWLFGAFALAFAIKVPLFPLHTWLPDAHVEAPTAGSVLLAGVLLKLGTYGLLRFNLALFPEATVKLVPVLAVLAVIGIIYGAAVAIVQPDLKKLVAYSSVSHLGFIVLGTFALTSQGLQGGVIQMVNHGVTTGALFLLVGMIYERRHTKKIADFGGLAKVMPIYAGMFLFTSFASIGLPGLNGFVGEFLVLLGSYTTLEPYAIIAAFGVVLAAVYLLWAYERVFTGPVTKPENEKLLDLNFREIAILVPLVALMLGLGLYPKPALDRIAPSTEAILDRIEQVTDFQVPEPGRFADVFTGGGAMSETYGVSYLAVAPEIILTLGAVLVLMIDVFRKPSARFHAWLVAATMIAATVLTWFQWDRVSTEGPFLAFSNMVVIDGYGVLASFILLVVGALGLATAWGMVERLGRRGAEGIVLVFMAIAGFQFMAVSANLVMMFMGLEIASISLYVLAGITRERPESDEAALKYFLLGSFASALFIYGVALSFAGTGGISIYEIGAFLRGNVVLEPGILLIGMALLIAGLAFKVSAAPFHVWAPDTYQGSPAGIVGFMASGAKVGAFAGLGRILITAFPLYDTEWALGLAVLAVLSIATGTFLAIAQSDIRRMLAYSGVAHAGFILTGLTAGEAGMPAVWFYLAAYTVQLIGAFAVVAAVAGPTAAGSPLSDYEGLSRKAPFLAAVLSILMLAMSGVPLTAGFVGKFGVFAAAWRADFEWLVILALVASVAGFFFYLRVIVLMYMHEPAFAEAPGTMRARFEPVGSLRWVLIVAVAVTLALGIYPTPLLDLVARALPF